MTLHVTKGHFSRVRRLAVWALIVLTAGFSLGPVIHAGIGHDADCDPIIVIHDPSQHRLIAAPPNSAQQQADDHCVICHLFRLSRISHATTSLDDSETVVRLIARSRENFAPSALAVVPLPARAPPALA